MEQVFFVGENGEKACSKGSPHAKQSGELDLCSEFAHERLVSVSQLLLSCVVAKFLSPRTLEELSQTRSSKLVQVGALHGLHELFDCAHESVIAWRGERGSAFSRLSKLFFEETKRGFD